METLVKKTIFDDFIFSSKELGGGNFDQVLHPYEVENSAEEKEYHYTKNQNKGYLSFNPYRAIEPIRIFFYFPREQLIPSDFDAPNRLFIGAKSCDLKALALLDRALINEDFVDPIYQRWRKNTIVISSDCTDITQNCHCNLVDVKPYPENNFDINISKYGEYYLMKSGSEKGKNILEVIENEFATEEPGKEVKQRVQKNREKVIERLKSQNEEFDYSNKFEILKNGPLSNWEVDSKDCIGCGGCTNICPTCYCVMFNDETKDKEFVKNRSMDSCQLNGYTKMAGGANPRSKMTQRFRNRYLCKFDYMVSDFDMKGCTGCGRCFEVCPGEIDIREVVARELDKSARTEG